jgi:C-terminal processing protease CtpA/Prc
MAALVGIGAIVTSVDGRIKIVALQPDGNAVASGNVRVGDDLVAVDGVRLTSVSHAKDLIFGPFGIILQADFFRRGQAVAVTLWRGGAEAQA